MQLVGSGPLLDGTSMSGAVSYRARWVFPVDGPPLAGGYVTVCGEKIIAVGTDPAGRCVDLGPVAVVPGLVNAHTHLDLSALRGQLARPSGFVNWLRQVIDHRRRQSEAPPSGTLIAEAVDELVAASTTLVGDIATGIDSAAALAAIGMPAFVFREVLGLGAARYEPLWQQASTAVKETAGQGASLVGGISPHAPYSTASEVYRRACQETRALPLATHWLESPAEVELLQTGRGPLRELLEDIGALAGPLDAVWDPPQDPWTECLAGSDRARWILIHANCLSASEIDRLASEPLKSRVAGVVYCPRTHSYFGHPAHPWYQLRRAGIRVGLGTDSLASNPDLSVFEDGRFLCQHDRSADPATVLQMLTWEGAQVLGAGDVTGTLTSGKRADLAVVAVPSGDHGQPGERLFASESAVVGTMIAGRWLRDPRTTLGP